MKAGIITVIVLAIIGGGIVALAHKDNKSSKSSTTSATSRSSTSPRPSSNQSATENTITYSDNGFSPATLTVTSGTKITIKNNSSGPLQFDSNPHPQHTDDPELNVGPIEPGSSATVTVTQTGSHAYHNHLNASDTGTIIVE